MYNRGLCYVTRCRLNGT